MGAGIQHDIIAGEIVAAAEFGTIRGGIEHLRVGAVGDELHPAGAKFHHVVDVTGAVDHHHRRAAVQEALEPQG